MSAPAWAPDAGLSGECVRTGEIVRCEDTETDRRADRLVCRRLDLRSIVIVPVPGSKGVWRAFWKRFPRDPTPSKAAPS